MNIEDIKVGKWYNVPFKVVEIKSGDIHMKNGGIKAVCQPSELSEITARQDVRSEHSTVGTLNFVERLEKLWNGMCNVLFDEGCQKYAEDLSKAMRNHIESITPDTENGTKNTEPVLKYYQNRLFRKGDKVKPRERNGRIPWAKDTTLTVVADESTAGVTVRDEETGEERLMCVLFLELVTPVEELEPYYVEDGGLSVMVNSRINERVVCCSFHKNVHPNAKAAAEAERDRLNDEWRKEQRND